MSVQAPRGTKDLYGKEVMAWQKLEAVIRELCEDFGIGEIRTPVFEHTELFVKGVGDTTDVVQKEMYTFSDRANRSLTLKPEGTAGAARAFLEHKMYAGTMPLKVYYATPLFRYEKPQAGRMRQFHQFGVEYFGAYGEAADAEVISVAYELLNRLGITNTTLYINSIGCKECRAKHREALLEFLSRQRENLCDTCKERMEKNPLRVLDCKEKSCREIVKNAPTVLDMLDADCEKHFKGLQRLLSGMGIAFKIDPFIVRGLDYYTRTVFEFISEDIGTLGTVCGGGRYDNLIEEYGGPATAAIGFGLGMERILIAMEKAGKLADLNFKKDIFIGSIGEAGFLKAQELSFSLKQQHISAESDIMGRSVKNQMKYADRIAAKYSMIIGDDEIAKNRAAVKNMETGESTEIDFSGLAGFIKGE